MLQASDLSVDKPTSDLTGQGHAVVLVRCNSTSLTFMNSWGTKWGDNGFFSVSRSDILLKARFFDVFWTLDQLEKSEIQAFEIKSKT